MKKTVKRTSLIKTALLLAGMACCYAAPARAGEVWLSDIAWTTATVGWGSMCKDAAIDINHVPLSINGVVYNKGVGVHAASQIIYDLNGIYAVFTSDVGVDDEVDTNGTVIFQIYVDDSLVYSSGLLTGKSPVRHASVDVTGKNQLKLVVTDGGDGASYDHADWAGAKLVEADPPPPPLNEIWLSDIAWTTATVGWGSMYKDRSIDASHHPFSLDYIGYEKGLGVHANSEICYDLNGAYKTFITDVGVDDEVASLGSVECYVLVNDSLVFYSGLMTGDSATQHVSVSVEGKKTLKLVATNGGDNIDFDHVDWAGAKLIKSTTTSVAAQGIRGRRNAADGIRLVMAGMKNVQPVDIFNLQGRLIGKSLLLPGGIVGPGIYAARFSGCGIHDKVNSGR